VKRKDGGVQSRSEQLLRFKKMAKELGVDESPGALDRALGRLDTKKKDADQLAPVKGKSKRKGRT
jgi:hypothetical protein